MLAFIIYAIIFIWVIRKVIKGDKNTKNKKKTVYQNTNKKNVNSKPTKSTAQTVYQNQPQNMAEAYQQMSDLKHRSKQKKSGKKKQQNYASAILEQAKKNVAENASDVLENTDSKWHENAGQQMENSLNEQILMDKVYDLMITGYNGNLQFERDFLAEGMDMISRLSVVDDSLPHVQND